MAKSARRLLVTGASGSGKSTRVKTLSAGARRVVVFDPMDEYARHRFTRCATLSDVLNGIKKGWSKTGFRLAYVPPAGSEPDALHRLACLLLAVQKPYRDSANGIAGAELVLVVEEMNLSFPVAALPRELFGFAELCSRGRHSGVEILGVSQRLAEINTRFRGNTDAAYFFRQSDHTDIATAARIIGPQHRARLLALQTHEFLLFQGGALSSGRNAGLRGNGP